MQTEEALDKDEIERRKIGFMNKKASVLADLHQTLTAKRGGDFRVELLQACSVATFCTEIENLREERSLAESERHVNQLMRFKLITIENGDGRKVFRRTPDGEKAVNAVKTFVNWMGDEQAEKIFKAHFGENSIRLFLKVYSEKWEECLDNTRVSFTPSELGRLTLFVPRTIEGMAAFEKLNDAGLLVYEEDGKIYIPSVIARNFYRYLSDLYDIIKVKIFKRNKGQRGGGG